MYLKGEDEMLGRFTRKSNIILLGIMIVGFALRFATLQTHGADLSIASDDIGYQKTANILLETGMLTYHEPDKPTIHIMPGFPALLAVVFYFLEMAVKVFL